MLLRTVSIIALSLFSLSSMASAGTQCPRQMGDSRLKHLDGEELYYGNPKDGMIQAPTTASGGQQNFLNIWKFPRGGAEGISLVCAYEHQPRPMVIPLPLATKECRQTQASMSCE